MKNNLTNAEWQALAEHLKGDFLTAAFDAGKMDTLRSAEQKVLEIADELKKR